MGKENEDGERLKQFTALLREDQIEALETVGVQEKRSKTFILREALDWWIEQRQKGRKERA